MGKRLAAVFLALALCLPFCISVSAEPIQESITIDYQNEKLTGCTPNLSYLITYGLNECNVTADENGEIPIVTDKYDFTGCDILMENTEKSIESLVTVPKRPSPWDLYTEDFIAGETSIVWEPDNIFADQYELSIDGTNWKNQSIAEKISYEGLTPNTEYTIKYRLAATDTSFVSEIKEIKITTKVAEHYVAIDDEHFPDENFREFVKSFDINEDDRLQDSEIAKVNSMYCSGRQIKDLTGIGYFTELEYLDCGNNEIASLDLRANTKLQQVHCNDNRLTSVNVSGIETLILLSVTTNNLKSIDVSTNTNLEALYCTYNQLTALDISNNLSLRTLSCSDNQLTSLDATGNPELRYLECNNNQLTSLDVTANPELSILMCSNNQLTTLELSNNKMLKELYCEQNQFTSLDISNNLSLERFYCSDNQLTSLDATGNPELRYLECNNNQLTSLDVTANPELFALGCSNNQLTSLDLSQNKELYLLYCQNNRLTSVDLSNCKNMGEFVDSKVYLEGNSYEIEAVNGTFDLSTLPGGFDVNRASEWNGATVKDGKLILADAKTVTYTYDLGRGKSGTFTLEVTNNKVVPTETDTKTPQTGDENNMFLWLALLLMSGGAVTAATVANNKRKYNR